MEFFTAPAAIEMGFQSPFRPLVIDLKSLYQLLFIFILNFIWRIVNIFNEPGRIYLYDLLNSARISLAACTICCKLATVSLSPRVFNPQSGFIQTCSTGIFATIKRIASLISSTLGTRRIQKRTTHSVVLFQ